MKKVKLPKTVKVGYAIYDVEFPYRFYTGHNLAGTHGGPWSTIRVCDLYNDHEASAQRALAVFVHELTHAIDFVFLGQSLTEHTIEVFAQAFIQIFRDNNLYLRSSKMPKQVRVGGLVYDVVYPFDFPDAIGFVTASINDGINTFYVGKESDGRAYSEERIKFNLMYSVLRAIISVYDVEEFSLNSGEEIDYDLLKIFAGGVYQTFRDNKIDNVILRNLGLPLYEE